MLVKLNPLNITNLKKKAKSLKRKPGGGLTNPVLRAINILRILERDNFKCVWCPNKFKLTIDHINGRKEFKHDDARKYKLDKCQTLCVDCHTIKNKFSVNDKQIELVNQKVLQFIELQGGTIK